jgi:hypothetical protein
MILVTLKRCQSSDQQNRSSRVLLTISIIYTRTSKLSSMAALRLFLHPLSNLLWPSTFKVIPNSLHDIRFSNNFQWVGLLTKIQRVILSKNSKIWHRKSKRVTKILTGTTMRKYTKGLKPSIGTTSSIRLTKM